MAKLIVKENIIRILTKNGVDYICITDIARQKNSNEPKDGVKNWLRVKNTLEYLGLWESLNNPDFKGVEFDPILREAGSNAFTMSPTRWVELTGDIGIINKLGREANPEPKGNIRDYASANKLICLSNMESLNTVFIEQGLSHPERLTKLNQIAIHQMSVLESDGSFRKLLK